MSHLRTSDLAVVLANGETIQSGGALVLTVLQGTPGPKGETGEPGVGASVTHTQSTPSTSWIVAHNLDVQFPDIEVFVGGVRHYPDISYSMNTATISFPLPATGVAIARR